VVSFCLGTALSRQRFIATRCRKSQQMRQQMQEDQPNRAILPGKYGRKDGDSSPSTFSLDLLTTLWPSKQTLASIAPLVVPDEHSAVFVVPQGRCIALPLASQGLPPELDLDQGMAAETEDMFQDPCRSRGACLMHEGGTRREEDEDEDEDEEDRGRRS
jgi:hypothetical protein